MGISAARQFWRNTSTTMNTSRIASNSVWTTSLTRRPDEVGRVEDDVVLDVRPASPASARSCFIFSLMSRAVLNALAAGQLEHRHADRRAVVQGDWTSRSSWPRVRRGPHRRAAPAPRPAGRS